MILGRIIGGGFPAEVILELMLECRRRSHAKIILLMIAYIINDEHF